MNLAAVAACAMIATALYTFRLDWPLRSLTFDLRRQVIYYLFGTLFALYTTALLAGFQVVLLAKRIRGFPKSRLATGAACVCVMAALFCAHVAYPKVRGVWHDWHLSSDPSRVTIEFTAWYGRDSEPREFVVTTNSNRSALQSLWIVDRLPESRILVVPMEKMQTLLLLLREEGFFEMPFTLNLFYHCDATRQELRVSNGQHVHEVASYRKTPEYEPFARLMSRLARELDIEE
ncbi:MAG: hypothetical protein HQ567_15655 [Candidatus Nealsonbacteria bacterium]|nr:hypothetical protein [Candidatus Nealsonbacteria bacterium]